MEFAVLSRLANILLMPGNLLFWAIVVGTGLLFTRWQRAGRTLLLVAASASLLIALLPLDIWLVRPLEDQFPRPGFPAQVAGILVLSPGPNTTVFVARGVPAPERGDGRLIATAELMRRYPSAKVIYSGGIAPLIGGAKPETVVARGIFAQMGVPPSRIIWENRARNTWENFVYSRALAQPKPADVWLVVTSALNMPRAMGIAQKLCWRVIPWPADYVSAPGPIAFGPVAFTAHLSALEMVAHEWLGLAAYQLTGRLGKGTC